MAERLEWATNNEKTDAQTLAAFGRKMRERVEDSGRLVLRNADARIVYIDPYFGSFAAADQNAPSRLQRLRPILSINVSEQHALVERAGLVSLGRGGDPSSGGGLRPLQAPKESGMGRCLARKRWLIAAPLPVSASLGRRL